MHLPAAATPRLCLHGLGHRYGSRQALCNVSLHAHAGERVAILGPNGAGKTTLFRLLCGLLPGAQGRVELDGVTLKPNARGLRAQMGVVFQEPSLDVRLTVLENLHLFATVHRIPRAQAETRLSQLLALVDLTARAHERVEHLSGGLRRRAELVRALLPAPRILVLDEPTVGVDIPGTLSFWNWLEGLCQSEGLCVLCTTHQEAEAMRCHRVVILNHGRVVATDTPQALIAGVGSDVLEVDTPQVEQAQQALATALGATPKAVGSVLSVPAGANGAAMVPQVAAALAGLVVHAITVRRPTLSDAFMALTGETLPTLHGARAS